MKRRIKEGLERIKKSKDAGVLIRNFGYLTALQFAGYIFPLVTIPYLARVIGVDSFGKIAFASAVITWFATITDWGFNYTATRDVAKNRNDHEKVSEIFSNVLWSRCILMLLSLGILIVAILIIPQFYESRKILLITFLLIPGKIMFPSWFFQAVERMKYISIMNLLSKIIFTAAVFIFIRQKSDYLFQPLFVSLGYVISGMVAMYIIIIQWKIKLSAPSWSKLTATIKRSSDVFINNLMPNLYNSFSMVLLGFYGGSVSTGLLDAGQKFVGVSQQFMSVLSRTFFPFLSRKIDKHIIYMKMNSILAIAISILLFLFAPIIIKWFFTPEFYDAIPILRIMSFSIIFISLANIYGTNYMIIQGHERQLRNITFAISIMGLILSFPLIYIYDYIGAAITVTATRGILGIAIMWKSRNIQQSISKS